VAGYCPLWTRSRPIHACHPASTRGGRRWRPSGLAALTSQFERGLQAFLDGIVARMNMA
jgi:hypothetical protein